MPRKKGSKIPKNDVVEFVLKDILKNKKEFYSQDELAKIIRQNLKKVEPGYAVSEKRVRSIILEIPGIRIQVETKKGALPKKCPSCGHTLKKIHTKNLKGRNVLIGLRCLKCGYEGKEGSWTPKRYVFKL
jgi:predicted RNA-binding Zn-ribbon protein involved in translation (DUF1610 family)